MTTNTFHNKFFSLNAMKQLVMPEIAFKNFLHMRVAKKAVTIIFHILLQPLTAESSNSQNEVAVWGIMEGDVHVMYGKAFFSTHTYVFIVIELVFI